MELPVSGPCGPGKSAVVGSGGWAALALMVQRDALDTRLAALRRRDLGPLSGGVLPSWLDPTRLERDCDSASDAPGRGERRPALDTTSVGAGRRSGGRS